MKKSRMLAALLIFCCAASLIGGCEKQQDTQEPKENAVFARQSQTPPGDALVLLCYEPDRQLLDSVEVSEKLTVDIASTGMLIVPRYNHAVLQIWKVVYRQDSNSYERDSLFYKNHDTGTNFCLYAAVGRGEEAPLYKLYIRSEEGSAEYLLVTAAQTGESPAYGYISKGSIAGGENFPFK